MHLTIKNQSNQHVEFNIKPPRRAGKLVCPSTLRVDAGRTMEITGPDRDVRALLAEIERSRPIARRDDGCLDPTCRLVMEARGDGR